MNYSAKLKDTRWQKKRLKILKRDEFRCRACSSDKETLHVHHLHYDGNKDPWDYPKYDLITLCKSCHEVWHKIISQSKIDPSHIWLVMNLWNELEWISYLKFQSKFAVRQLKEEYNG